MSRKIKITAVVFAFLALLTITSGVTLAFFSYSQVGLTENTITVGNVSFHYKEQDGKGRGITITDSLPVASNDDAKISDKYFTFRITASITNGIEIPYTVTARMNPNSDSILGDIVDVYLTEVTGSGEEPTQLFTGVLPKYNELEQYDQVDNYTEKVIYTDTVTTTDYEKEFRYRMWIDQNINLNTGNGTSIYNNKEFSVTINVYATGSSVNSNNNSNEEPVNTICTLASGDYLEVGSKYNCELGNLDSNDQPILTSFYLLSKDEDASTANLIMEHNITEGSKYTQITRADALNYFTDPTVAEGEGVAYLESWTNIDASNVSLPGSEEMVNIVDPTWNLENATLNNTTFIYNTPKDANNISTYSWLYNYTRLCDTFGCDPTTNFTNTYYNSNNEKEAYGYWLKDTIASPDDPSVVYGFTMLRSGILQTMETDALYGLRPVIKISLNQITQ